MEIENFCSVKATVKRPDGQLRAKAWNRTALRHRAKDRPRCRENRSPRLRPGTASKGTLVARSRTSVSVTILWICKSNRGQNRTRGAPWGHGPLLGVAAGRPPREGLPRSARLTPDAGCRPQLGGARAAELADLNAAGPTVRAESRRRRPRVREEGPSLTRAPVGGADPTQRETWGEGGTPRPAGGTRTGVSSRNGRP